MLHVDEFIDKTRMGPEDQRYARWFFALHRFPAAHRADYAPWMDQYKLFCTWRGERWRVTGCSRMGDVWLAHDFDRKNGYDRRVDVAECSGFTAYPEPLQQSSEGPSK